MVPKSIIIIIDLLVIASKYLSIIFINRRKAIAGAMIGLLLVFKLEEALWVSGFLSVNEQEIGNFKE